MLRYSFILSALLLTHCGKKNFTSNTEASSTPNAAASTNVPPVATDPAVPVATPPPTTTPGADLLVQDACVSTVQWYDGFNWIPYVSDADCIKKMKALVNAQSQDMLNFEVRHLTRAQLVDFSGRSADTAAFVALFESQSTPIYSFTDGWINE